MIWRNGWYLEREREGGFDINCYCEVTIDSIM